jgi:hypothetical protein
MRCGARAIRAGTRVCAKATSSSTRRTLLLRPGEEEYAIDALLRVIDEKPVRYSVTVDNSGTPSTGRLRVGFGQNANLSGIDDVLSLQYVTDKIGDYGHRLSFTLDWRTYDNKGVREISDGSGIRATAIAPLRGRSPPKHRELGPGAGIPGDQHGVPDRLCRSWTQTGPNPQMPIPWGPRGCTPAFVHFLKPWAPRGSSATIGSKYREGEVGWSQRSLLRY